MPIRISLVSLSIALAVLLAGLLAFLIPEGTYACAPTYIGPPLEELERNNSVFRGKVISATPLDRESGRQKETMYEFMVTTVWKGSLAEKRTITSGDDGAACGRRFGFGEYIVYSGDGYTDGFSTRTRSIYEAAEDLAELGEGQMPIPGTVLPPLEAEAERGEDQTPTSTSENGGGCGISPNRTDLSIAALIVGIVGLSLGRRRPPPTSC